MSIASRQWLSLIEAEYLDGLVRDGGAAVKLAVVDEPEQGSALLTEIERRAQERSYLSARIDAARVKVHMMQDVFFAIAERVPWEALAARTVRRDYAESGYRLPESGELAADAVAATNGVDAPMLHAEMRRSSERLLRQGADLAKDFRIAMYFLCQAQVRPGGIRSDAILAWLQGELRLISALRDHLIFRKIGRHNARAMLASLGAWARANDLPGLVLTLDLRRLSVARRSEVTEGLFYTKAAATDAYEVLRQLIDATDDLRGVLCVVLIDRDLLDRDHPHSLRDYRALYERVQPDVRLRERDNPLSALAHLSADSGSS